MMEVVPFQESDIDTVFEIQRTAYKPLYEKYQDHDTNPYLEHEETTLQKYMRENTKGYLFVENGAAVGCVRVALYPDMKSAKISALAVLPQYQGQGIAQQALSVIENLHKDVERWFLDTILQEPGNCHLYEKLGYRRSGKIETINDKMTLVFYEKGYSR